MPPDAQQIRIDPMTGKAHTLDGKPVPIDKETYRTRMLPAILERASHLPDLLYQVIVGALQQGFFAETIPSCQRLLEIDRDGLRGTTALAIALMNSGRVDEAETRLRAYLDEHGPDGVIMLNLAKAQAMRGQQEQAEDTLFDALEVDPNVPNAVQWWAQLHHQRDAQGGFERGLLQVDAIEGSWYAKLWLARLALKQGDNHRALALYEQALPFAREHTEPMFMISGDLGNAGLPQEVLRLVAPHYALQTHGPMTGMNVVRACAMVGAREQGLAVLDELDALDPPEMRPTLAELRKAFEV